MFYHIKIELKGRSKKKETEFILDLTETEARKNFIEAYKSKKEIIINNKHISSAKIGKLTIIKTDTASVELINEYKNEASKGKPWILMYDDFEKLLDKSNDKQEYIY